MFLPFFRAPAEAKKAQEEIEEMIRQNQEAAEALKEKQKELAGAYETDENKALYEIYTCAYDMHLTAIGDAVIFSLGANSYIHAEDCEELIEHCQGKPTFWITTYGVSNDSNEVMASVVAKHDNAYIIDWEAPAMDHPEWILSDHLHPNAQCHILTLEEFNEQVSPAAGHKREGFYIFSYPSCPGAGR